MKRSKLKVNATIVLTLIMLMISVAPGFAAEPISKQEQHFDEDICHVIELDFHNIVPGETLYEDEVYLLEDGTIVYNADELKEAEARGIPFINVVLRRMGVTCWTDNRIEMFCNFICDEKAITKVSSVFYAQDVDMPLPLSYEEADVTAYDAHRITHYLASPTDGHNLSYSLRVPNIYEARVGIIDTTVTTLDRTVNFVDQNEIITRR